MKQGLTKDQERRLNEIWGYVLIFLDSKEILQWGESRKEMKEIDGVLKEVISHSATPEINQLLQDLSMRIFVYELECSSKKERECNHEQ